MNEFTHYSEDGGSRMVDIGEKEITRRVARAQGRVRLSGATLDLIEGKLLPKGDLFEIARVAGIMAAKRCDELIPLCHSLELSFVDLKVALDRTAGCIVLTSEVRLHGRTGAEMEALTAVSVAALTVYDMCKAVDTQMVIEEIALIEKKGGKSEKAEISNK